MYINIWLSALFVWRCLIAQNESVKNLDIHNFDTGSRLSLNANLGVERLDEIRANSFGIVTP